MKSVLPVVEAFIAKERLLVTGRPVIVALSGGADSTALLCMLHELGYSIMALHCNFHLRGEESMRDQRFVEALCRRKGIELQVKDFDTETIAQERGISLEMAARDLRYEWFRDVMNRHEAQAIAVAHHKDDQAETVLLNLARGTGLRGLAGMHPCRNGIVRPLLCINREEILAYLHEQGQDYVTDSTNAERIARRNVIRLDVLPLMQQLNPQAVEALANTAHLIRQSLVYYQEGVETCSYQLHITPDAYPLTVAGNSVLLYEWLEGKGFTQSQLTEMGDALSSPVGRLWQSPTHTVLRDRENLLLHDNSVVCPQPRLIIREVEAIGEKGLNTAYLDADLLRGPIEVRLAAEGDWFVPFGMKGRKLLSDFLTDRKLTRFEKERQWVATCDGDIVWVIGQRSDNRYRVTERTKRIVSLSVNVL